MLTSPFSLGVIIISAFLFDIKEIIFALGSLKLGIVVIFCMIYPNDFNLELMGRFFDIMERVITLIGGGYLGVQVGENYPLRRNKK